jgi:hypothetical protein
VDHERSALALKLDTVPDLSCPTQNKQVANGKVEIIFSQLQGNCRDACCEYFAILHCVMALDTCRQHEMFVNKGLESNSQGKQTQARDGSCAGLDRKHSSPEEVAVAQRKPIMAMSTSTITLGSSLAHAQAPSYYKQSVEYFG